MPRQPKPTSTHKSQGTYQKCRHSERMDEQLANGLPEKPAGLSDDASWLWDVVVGGLPESVQSSTDAPLLMGMSQWWDLYRRLGRELAKMDGDYKEHWALYSMVSSSWKHFSSIASKFGMSPADRAKVKPVGDGENEEDPLEAMLKRRGNN